MSETKHSGIRKAMNWNKTTCELTWNEMGNMVWFNETERNPWNWNKIKRNETKPGGVIDMKLNHIESTDEWVVHWLVGWLFDWLIDSFSSEICTCRWFLEGSLVFPSFTHFAYRSFSLDFGFFQHFHPKTFAKRDMHFCFSRLWWELIETRSQHTEEHFHEFLVIPSVAAENTWIFHACVQQRIEITYAFSNLLKPSKENHGLSQPRTWTWAEQGLWNSEVQNPPFFPQVRMWSLSKGSLWLQFEMKKRAFWTSSRRSIIANC